jgi:DNA-binding CsgD family transcriptional regulator
MLEDSYMSVFQAKSREELQTEVVRFTQTLGFETVAAMAVVDHVVGDPEFMVVENTPVAYREVFFDREVQKRDPVTQHCKRQSVPMVWNQDTYVKAGQGEMWEHQARFGFRCGIALAIHLPEGRHFVVGVDRDQDLPTDRNELTRMVASLQLFAVHAQDAAMRVLVPPSPDQAPPLLTPRELEVLKWTMEGKTAWEVASLLGISERTAVLHANNAMHKLHCVNKHQAVLKALRLGLIR